MMSDVKIELTPRERMVLRSVIYSYIMNANPIGSRTLTKQYEMGLSPATIRNTMADLEALGLLEQPFTSAGRRPTLLGYRVYVDNLMGYKKLTHYERKIIEHSVGELTSNALEILQRTAKLLTRLSNLLGAVITHRIEGGILQHIDISRLTSDKILVIIAVKSGTVKTIILELNFKLQDKELEDTCRMLNQRLCGLPLSQIREQFAERVRELSPDSRRDLIALFADNIDQLFQFEGENDYYMTGFKKLLSQPEFTAVDKMRAIVELMEDKNALVHLVGNVKPEDGIRITIGEEAHFEPSRHLSVISSALKMGDNIGTMSIIGPTRMNYSKLCAIIEYTTKTIERQLNR